MVQPSSDPASYSIFRFPRIQKQEGAVPVCTRCIWRRLLLLALQSARRSLLATAGKATNRDSFTDIAAPPFGLPDRQDLTMESR